MDYSRDAFGGLNPQADQDAALKFALNVVLMDDRLEALSSLLTEGHDIGAIAGEPGWIIERRDSGPAGDMPGYANWPSYAKFHAHVDPAAYHLRYPDYFADADTFRDYVRTALQTYIANNPAKAEKACNVMSRSGVLRIPSFTDPQQRNQ